MFPWKTRSVWHLSFSVVRLVTVYFNGVFTLSCPPTMSASLEQSGWVVVYMRAVHSQSLCVRTCVTLSNVTHTGDASFMLLTYKNCLFETFLQFVPLHFCLPWFRRMHFLSVTINRFVFVFCYSTSMLPGRIFGWISKWCMVQLILQCYLSVLKKLKQFFIIYMCKCNYKMCFNF